MKERLTLERKNARIILSTIKQRNTKSKEAKKILDDALSMHENNMRTQRILNDILVILKEQRRIYVEQTKSNLTLSLERAIDRVIGEDKSYRVKLQIDTQRFNNTAQLLLVDDKGRELPPSLEGDMLNQLISFLAVVYISMQNGIYWFFYDEAFSSSNARSQRLIRESIEEFLDLGMNFLFVVQQPFLVAPLKRRLIDLQLRGAYIGNVEVTDIDVVDGVMDLDSEYIDYLDRINKGVF